jgi:hypothetical protein
MQENNVANLYRHIRVRVLQIPKEDWRPEWGEFRGGDCDMYGRNVVGLVLSVVTARGDYVLLDYFLPGEQYTLWWSSGHVLPATAENMVSCTPGTCSTDFNR